MTHPSPTEIFELIDTSWPPADALRSGPWVLRRGLGGSKRTMAASCLPNTSVTEEDIDLAEAHMRNFGQPLMFQIRGENPQLDTVLDTRGYAVVDRCTIYAGATEALARPLAPATAWAIWEPLAIQKDIWAEGGIDAGRLEIMQRAGHPKTSIIGRVEDRAAGAAFVSGTGKLAMIHAVETLAAKRKKGVGANMMAAAANWCVSQGIDWLTLIVTTENKAGNALYTSLGMIPVGSYHYRIREAS